MTFSLRLGSPGSTESKAQILPVGLPTLLKPCKDLFGDCELDILNAESKKSESQLESCFWAS